MIDVGQGVRGERDLGHHLLVRRLRRGAARARRWPPRGWSPARTGASRRRRARRTSDCVASARPGELSRQRHALGGLVTLRARGGSAAGVAEPDERVAAEVRDQEGHLARVQLARQAARRARRRRRTAERPRRPRAAPARSSRGKGSSCITGAYESVKTAARAAAGRPRLRGAGLRHRAQVLSAREHVRQRLGVHHCQGTCRARERGVEPAAPPPGRSPRISRGSSTTAASNSSPLIARGRAG